MGGFPRYDVADRPLVPCDIPGPGPGASPLDWLASTAMGFDPQRQHRRSTFDYWFVGAAIVICAALVIWALAG